MIAAGSVEYAFTRMWSRQGARAGEALWRRIEPVRDFAAFLALVRASPLAVWVVGVGADAAPHAIESAARRHLRALVADVARWMPDEWTGAVAWCAHLIDLPVLLHLAAADAEPAWLRDEPVLGSATAAHRAVAGDDLAALREAAPGGATHLIRAWRSGWDARLPCPVAASPVLTQLAATIEAHERAFATAHPADGGRLRRELDARLTALFRRAGIDPAAAFVFIALAALEYERIRGELLRRRTLPAQPLAA